MTDLDAAIAAVRAVYQPVVDLRTRQVMAHEALARGPAGTDLERPDRLFGAAAAAGRTTELDRACQAAAVRGAREAGMGPFETLFVNVEPSSLGDAAPPGEDLRLVLEITERAFAHDPAALLAGVRRARAVGWGVAVDDVGAEPASLALMPFLDPDVIKLDMRLVQEPDARAVEVVHAVRAQAERTGATILAEGIETEAHLQVALAMGAELGQGWLFGRPGPLQPTGNAVPFHAVEEADRGSTPFEVVAKVRPVQSATKGLLLPTSRFLEARSIREPEPPVVLSTFQDASFFTPMSARRYAELAARSAFVGALAAGLEPEPAPGVRGAALAPEDPVRGEWDVLVITPHFAGALVARDLGDRGPDLDRRFEHVVTYDRELVLAAARSLFARILPLT